ncbi:hypothetical protein [Haloarchaeobius sp. TZWWS8]|uniref:hypothetical protein n=1 Tax=Haloarchaeobius sp. TZWWS8 TaxID=3446121 RepID=UPI003EBC87CF
MAEHRADDATDRGEKSRVDEDTTRVWLVERTYSDDEQNIIILVYATEDGRFYHRRERALTSFTGDHRVTRAALDVPESDIGPVDDPEEREQYAREASRMASEHAPDDAI